LWLPLDS